MCTFENGNQTPCPTYSLYLLTLGCDKNRVDGEVMLGRLISTGVFSPVDDPAIANIIIVNTCGFIREATQESIDTILEMAEYRTNPKTPCRGLIITGCMSERYREETKAEIPEADAILGVKDADSIVKAVADVLGIEVEAGSGNPRVKSSPYVHNRHIAHIKISDGCDNACTYCTIPSIRGAYISRPIEEILEECRLLSHAREFVLVAQDTALYGFDLYGEPRLHKLMKLIAELPNRPRVRLMYAYPEHITPEIVKVIAETPNVCKYIDLPIQHSETEILRRMGRKSSRETLLTLINNLREEIPDIALRTTLMVGFPGETTGNFQGLYDFVKKVKFDRLGVFPYSQEEGTPAAALPKQVGQTTKFNRLEKLMELQQGIHHEKQTAKIGKTIDVIVDEIREDDFIGRTEHDAYEVDAVVCFTAPQDFQLNPGDIVKVTIYSADDYDLQGVLATS